MAGGWRVEGYGRSVRGAELRVHLPARPRHLLVAGMHGEEPETVQLARYAAGLRYDDLPATVVAAAKDCIIDTVAACICGAALPWSRIVIDYAERTGPGGTSRILGRGSAVRVQAGAGLVADSDPATPAGAPVPKLGGMSLHEVRRLGQALSIV